MVLQGLREQQPAKRDIVLEVREKKMNEGRAVAIAAIAFWVALVLSAVVMGVIG